MAVQQVKQTIRSTAQDYLDIHDITNNILILKDGSTAVVITVSAMNFGLLAEPEQDAIMYAYAGLLNSLNYPVQIVVRSKTKDVTRYLNLLDAEEGRAGSNIKKAWIRRYRNFVSNLIKERNVLDKKFYCVVPASALEMGFVPPQTVVPGVKGVDISSIERSVIVDKAVEILEPKRDHLITQFARIGLQARQLETQEIIQLFYTSYNAEAAQGQEITDTGSYTTALVSASMQGGAMNDGSNPVSDTQQAGQVGQVNQPADQTQQAQQTAPAEQPAQADQPSQVGQTNQQPQAPTSQPTPPTPPAGEVSPPAGGQGEGAAPTNPSLTPAATPAPGAVPTPAPPSPAGQPTGDQPTSNQQAGGQPPADQSAQSAGGQPAADQAAVGQTAMGQPPAASPSATQPAATQPIVTQPATSAGSVSAPPMTTPATQPQLAPEPSSANTPSPGKAVPSQPSALVEPTTQASPQSGQSGGAAGDLDNQAQAEINTNLQQLSQPPAAPSQTPAAPQASADQPPAGQENRGEQAAADQTKRGEQSGQGSEDSGMPPLPEI